MKDYFKEIKEAKVILRKKSKDYKKNFQKIEQFIKAEVNEIKHLKQNKQQIIPEISFKDLNTNNNSKVIDQIKRRGCVVIRDVFEDNQISQWNKDIEEYIEKNNYYEKQKEKAGLDNYFSNLEKILYIF